MNYNSKEFYINMKEKDIPKWDPLYTYDEQDDDVKQFWDNEALKLTEGVTINGVYIHPWLYWHLNFWHMMLDKGMDRVPGLSSLRDNEWFFAEMLQKAEEQNKAIFMFGTRRFGKALLNSEILYMEQGEKTIGEALVGDKIYDDAGKLTEITGVYPQGRVMTYKVTFEDGRNCICCGDHLWRVKRLGSWKVLSLKSLIASNYKECSIQLCEAIDYPDAKLPIAPNAYGAIMAAYLSGDSNDIVLKKSMNRLYIRSSRRQKKIFVESFIKYMGSIVTSNEKFYIKNIDYTILHFVKQMFWSCGWYASFNDGFLTLSSTKKEIAITSIEVYGNHEATCITVSNHSRLFLTTNYIVTHNSAIMSSFLARNATMTYNLTHNVICASADDLLTLTEYLEFGLDNMHPFLKINRTGNNWDKEVVLGTRNIRNERDVHARIRITNIDQGKTAASLKTAGGTPFTSIYDEVGKFPFLNAYLAGKPAHMANGRMRGMILAAGCCCAGTVVYKANGEPCYIEDLRQTDGIIGYDIETGKLSIEDIEWMKPPSSKPCRRLATAMGRIIECSIDHPILVLDCFTQKPKFVRADRIVPGDEICVSSAADGRVLGEEGFPVESIDLYEKGIIIDPIVSNINIGNKLVYNLTASNTHTYLANGIITHNTGGNVEKSQDAQKVMNNPASYGFMVMDYDLLNKRCVTPTWRICKSGCFVPGQMSHAYPKDKTTLDKYLGKENSPMLKKIPISVTNYERSTAKIKEDLEGFSKSDKELFIQTKMAYPLTIDDCFLNAAVNRFPIEDATIHKNRLLEQGRPGQLVDVFQLEGKKMGWRPSDKMLAPFPFKGGNIDCPIVMYEEPPKDGGNLDDYVYVSSLDPYKQDKANTESLGAFYVFKRYVAINDPFAYKIVASYVSRPPKSDDFCRNCEILIEGYGAKCLMENADRMFELYLARRNKEMLLLEDGEKVASKIIRPGARQNNRLGLSPTLPNQRMLYNAVLQYCWEEVVVGFDEDGNEIKQKGIYRIDDIELLEEMIAFGPGVNTDRIVAFGHALLLAKYYDDMNFMPKSTTEKMNQEKIAVRKLNQYKGFVLRRHNPFKLRR